MIQDTLLFHDLITYYFSVFNQKLDGVRSPGKMNDVLTRPHSPGGFRALMSTLQSQTATTKERREKTQSSSRALPLQPFSVGTFLAIAPSLLET